MDLVQFTIGLAIVLVGIAVIISPELTTRIIISPELARFVAAVLVILGAVTIYDAVYGKRLNFNSQPNFV
jgi:hypothetical protein